MSGHRRQRTRPGVVARGRHQYPPFHWWPLWAYQAFTIGCLAVLELIPAISLLLGLW